MARGEGDSRDHVEGEDLSLACGPERVAMFLDTVLGQRVEASNWDVSGVKVDCDEANSMVTIRGLNCRQRGFVENQELSIAKILQSRGYNVSFDPAGTISFSTTFQDFRDGCSEMKGVEEPALAVVENLNPAQQVALQKLLKCILGPSKRVKGGNWELRGIKKVVLSDSGIRIEGLNIEQSGMPKDGRGQSLVELLLGKKIEIFFSGSNAVTITIPVTAKYLGAMTMGDVRELFGRDLVMDVTLTDVLSGDFDSDVAEERRLVAEGVGEAVDAALARRIQ